MTENKLTPRVGDRVIVKTGAYTKIGNIIGLGSGGKYASVDIDGWGVSGGFLTRGLTVVDRDPVEWPEGWGRRALGLVTWLHGSRPLNLSRAELLGLQRDIPDMLARWDELMAGGE
jgi:hypothetical protein